MLTQAITVVAVVCAGAALVQTLRLSAYAQELADATAEIASERLSSAQAAADATDRYRLAERRVTITTQEATANARQQTDAARAAAGRAAGLVDSLRSAAAAAGGCAATSDPAAAAGSAPADPGGSVLADVLSRAASAAVELARVADERRAAGQACERIHDAVSAP